ncbi:MAG: hypothetical protein JRF61_09365 [Deltaproteobacteria bacterium]|nr:hypothetical protein [Deltaproteobacteria bacterium]
MERRWGSVGRLASWAMGLVLCMGPGAVGAESPDAEAPDTSGEEPLRVPPSPGGRSGGAADGAPGLESLLQLPPGFGTRGEQPAVAGASEAEWRRRFRRSYGELEEARAQLEATKGELDEIVDEGGSQWAVAPPIGGATPEGASNSPLSFKLRQQLKGDRERVEAAERAMRELRIEADLAGVPRTWQSEGAPVDGEGAPREIPVDP